MPGYKFGEIVLVRFHPAFGTELKKYRPAVVMCSTLKIDKRFVLVAPLTTKLPAVNEFELMIEHKVLKKKSLLLCWYLRTVDQIRVVKRVGEVAEKDKNEIKKRLMRLFE